MSSDHETRWNSHFLSLALQCARMSRDPRTQVGAVIVGPDREVRSTGFNGFPRLIKDTPERLGDRELKNSLMVHAEHNAILHAARVGVSVKGCTLYLVATDDTGEVWGGAPCVSCTLATIQVGIGRVISPPFKSVPSVWAENVKQAALLLLEAGVQYTEILWWPE